MCSNSLIIQQWGLCLITTVFVIFVGEVLRSILRLTANRPERKKNVLIKINYGYNTNN